MDDVLKRVINPQPGETQAYARAPWDDMMDLWERSIPLEDYYRDKYLVYDQQHNLLGMAEKRDGQVVMISHVQRET